LLSASQSTLPSIAMSLELEALTEFLTGSKLTTESVPWWLLRAEDVRVIRAWARATLPAASQRSLLKALRAVLAHAVADDDEISSGRRPLKVNLSSAGWTIQRHGLGARESRLLLETSREAVDAAAARDTAVISLLLLAGLKRPEIVRLQTGDYDEDDGHLSVRSPGRSLRSVMLQGECRDDMDAWLRQRGNASGPIFLRFNSKRLLLMTGLSSSSVNRILSRRCSEAGGLAATPSELRSRFLRQLQLAGRRDERPPCRYYQDENGTPAWTLASMASP
jgi:integrase